MGKYEPRAATELGAQKIDQVLHFYKACLLKVGTGGGKTYMSIHAVGRISLNANILVITTAKQAQDLKEFQKSIKSYSEYYHANFNTMVTNYDQLTSRKHKWDAYNWVKQQPQKSTVIILDEAHKIKNPTSQTSKMITKIANLPATSRIIMATATPYSNSLLDSMTYLILAGFYKNKTQFQRMHVKYFDEHHQPIVRRRDGTIDLNLLDQPDIIMRRLNAIKVEIDTTKILPKRFDLTEKFAFDKPTQKEYRKIRKGLKEGVYESVQEAIKAQRDFVAAHSQKRFQRMKYILTKPTRPQTPVLVFYQYKTELHALQEFFKNELPDYNLLYINGQQNDYDADNPPTNAKDIIICQYQAAGEGINIPQSELTIFYAPAQSAEKYQQARGRNRRAGTKNNVYQFRLVVLKTISQHYWYDLIDKKQKFTKEVAERMLQYDD